MVEARTSLGAAGTVADDRQELRVLGELAAAGDPDAWERLYARGIEVIHALAHRLAPQHPSVHRECLLAAGLAGLGRALDLRGDPQATLQLRLGAASWIAGHVHRAMRSQIEAGGRPSGTTP